MNEEISKALAFDPIATAERLTGLDSHTEDSVVFLGMFLAQEQGKKKAELLRANRDTCMQNNLIQQIEAIEGMGFRLLCSGDVPGTDDKWRIYWREGVLLFFDSYWGDKSMNGGNAYFNYCGPRDAMKCSNGHVGEIDGQPVWAGNIDAREGLRHYLDALSEVGTLLPVWIERPFLWLLHYQDTKVPGYDYKAINAERIAMLPAEIQKAIIGRAKL